MSEDTQILLIARLLAVPVTEVAYLERLPAAERPRLRRGIERHLHRAGDAPLRQLTGASSLVPAALCARVAEKVLGPLVTAMLAHRVDRKRALAILGHLEPAFLAEVASHLSAEDCAALIERIPEARLRAVMAELAVREDVLTLVALLGHLPAEFLTRTADGLPGHLLAEILLRSEDPERLVRAAARARDARLGPVIEQLPATLRERLQAAAGSA